MPVGIIIQSIENFLLASNVFKLQPVLIIHIDQVIDLEHHFRHLPVIIVDAFDACFYDDVVNIIPAAGRLHDPAVPFLLGVVNSTFLFFGS